MASHQDDDFDALLEKSSLGGSAARRLRERTSASRARTVRKITELRHQIRHSSGAPQDIQAARELLRLLEGMGYRTQDEVPDELLNAARRHVPVPSGSPVEDNVALTEMEMCGELIIAASSTDGERLSQAHIDEVLRVGTDRGDEPASSTANEGRFSQARIGAQGGS